MWKSFVRKNILWIILALMLVGINLFYLYLLKADVRDIEYAVLLDLFLIIGIDADRLYPLLEKGKAAAKASGRSKCQGHCYAGNGR